MTVVASTLSLSAMLLPALAISSTLSLMEAYSSRFSDSSMVSKPLAVAKYAFVVMHLRVSSSCLNQR